MNDSGVKYAQTGRIKSGETQYIQNGGMQNNRKPYIQSNRLQNNKAEYVQDNSRREHKRRQEQKKRVGWLMALAVFAWTLLLLNFILLLVMLFRIQSMKDILGYMESLLQLPEAKAIYSSEEYEDGAAGWTVPETIVQREEQDYVSLCGLDWVDKPVERTREQVLERLEELGESNEMIEEIFQESYSYPDKLLEALANNPEMADFVKGYPENDGKTSGGLTEKELSQDFPLFLQWDPRWGYGKYGDDSNIGLSGCGPTCLSMALYYLTENESLTPDKIAAYSMKNGYYISGTGTAWALLEEVPAQYGIEVSQPKAEESVMKTALDHGNIIICSVGPGDFTVGGHFIVIYGYDKSGFLVNDPNCVARSRRSWTFSELKGQMKNIWVLGGASDNGTVSHIGL